MAPGAGLRGTSCRHAKPVGTRGRLPSRSCTNCPRRCRTTLDEEERDVLNPARTDVDDETLARLGADFATEREIQLDLDCGSIENVRKIVSSIPEDS